MLKLSRREQSLFFQIYIIIHYIFLKNDLNNFKKTAKILFMQDKCFEKCENFNRPNIEKFYFKSPFSSYNMDAYGMSNC